MLLEVGAIPYACWEPASTTGTLPNCKRWPLYQASGSQTAPQSTGGCRVLPWGRWVPGACGELSHVADNTAAFPEVAKSHLEEEEPLPPGVTQPPSARGQRTKDLLPGGASRRKGGSRASGCAKRRRPCCIPRGKRRRYQLRTTTEPSGRPPPAVCARWSARPVQNCTALREQVGPEQHGVSWADGRGE